MVLDARPETAARPAAPPSSVRPDGRPEPAGARAPRLARGVELLGEYEGSGYKEAPYLARRGDGQTIQLSRLLYAVAESCDGQRSYDDVAAEASRRFGKRLSARNARTIVEDKLTPLGVVVNNDGSEPVLSKPDSLLALRLRKSVIPPRLVRALTTVFYPLFLPPVVIAALAGLGVFDWWLFVHHGVAQGIRATVLHPGLFLVMFVAVVVSAFLHECGHATGLRYGGGEPGTMGAGVYLAFPAFYTDVTDAYRLGKGGRLRTDLGGVYFNALFMLGTAGIYAVTRFEPLLFLILVQHIEIAHQFLPFLRLDGYYIVADAVGVPDLFTRIGPILRSALPGRKGDPRVTALKPWVRLFVTTWVLVVVPFLMFNLTLLLVHLPRLLATGAQSMHKQWGTTTAAFGDGRWLVGTGGVVQSLALLLPFAGIVYTLFRLGTRIGRRSWAWSADSPVKRAIVVLAGVGMLALLGRAWLPGRHYTPIRPGERGTLTDYVAASTTVIGHDDVAPAFVPSGVGPAGAANPAAPAGTSTDTTTGTTPVDPSLSPTPSPSAATGLTSESPAPSESPTPEASLSPTATVAP
ncbi:MAG: putative peptide zinc metalloprotease protein [Frankiaceae bacterium]|jgi:putative peptide zinc metalloprotease protein|nr:putative peptide zinc metalloprotease protein [Frankiaceae bacterium]